MSRFIRDDFAGPGGWDVALSSLGLPSVGVEFEASATATARAAGFKRWFVDVTKVRDYAWPELWGYIASPSCQSFSMAGGGSGRRHMAHLLDAARLVAQGATPEEAVAQVSDEALDERSVLVLEPLLVIRDHRPRWVAMEQVPPVLPVWEVYAEVMRGWGYSVETGNLHSEQYGVPQTRRRAVLVASLDKEARLPTPTHSKYYARSKDKLDPGVEKWVSMAEALGWGAPTRPSFTVTGGGGATGGAEPYGSRAREAMLADEDFVLRNNTSANAAVRHEDLPAPTMYFGQRLNGVFWHPASGEAVSGMSTSRRPNSTVRTVEEPSPTIIGGNDSANRRWLTMPEVNNQSGTVFDLEDQITHPASVIAGRDIVTFRGANANRFNGATKSRNDGIRITVQEAAVLQTFPPNYPWRGTKTQQFQQVGNAIPPLLARAIVEELISDV